MHIVPFCGKKKEKIDSKQHVFNPEFYNENRSLAARTRVYISFLACVQKTVLPKCSTHLAPPPPQPIAITCRSKKKNFIIKDPVKCQE